MTGRWWLPRSPDQQVAGALTLDANDFAVSTEGALQRTAELDAGEELNELWWPAHHDVVLGSLSTGEDVTLVDCWGLATVLPATEVLEVWRPRAALLGVHLINTDEEAFNSVSIQLEHLPAFAGNPGIGLRIEQRQDGTTTEAALNAERRVLHRAAVGNSSIQVIVSPRASIGHAEGHLKVEVSFDIAQGSRMTWEDAWTVWTLSLRDLLSMLSGEPCSVGQVVLRSTGGHTATPGVRLLRRTSDLRRRPRKPLSTDDFIIHAGNLPGGFEEGLRKWLEIIHSRRSIAIREIADVLHAPFPYVEDEFLAYTRAIGPLLNEDTKLASADAAHSEQQQWLNDVREALPQHLRDGVMAQLNPPGPNERHRLLALIDHLDPVGAWLTGGDPAGFAARVIATRGQLVHPSHDPQPKLLEGLELVQHTHALGWLVRALIVSGLGMPIDELGRRLRGTDASRVADELAESRRRRADADE